MTQNPNSLISLGDPPSRIEAASDWDGWPFAPPPLSIRGRVRRGATNLCCLAGMAAAKMAGSLHADRKPAAPRKILVIRRGGLGDVLMATPLLRGLREHFPAARIYVLASRQARAGLVGCPSVDEILEMPTTKSGWLRLLRQLREEKIDTAFILHRFFAASLLALAAGIRQRLGFAWQNHGFALTASIPFSPMRSQTLQISELLTLVGKPAAAPGMDFHIPEGAVRSARELLAGWGYDRGKPLVGIHPGGGETAGSSEPPKRWLPERFGRLADLLIAGGEVQVVLLQGPGDEPFVEKTLQNMNRRALGIASGLPLAVFAALVGECHLVVANDTGPMHLAAALNVPVVAILGPTHPAYTPPRGAMHKVIWAGVPCSPCYHPEEYLWGTNWTGKKVFECWRGTHECMAAITPGEVHDAVIRQIHALENAPQGQGFRSPIEFHS